MNSKIQRLPTKAGLENRSMSRHRILIADNDATSVAALVRLLMLQGHEVRAVHGVRQAVRVSASFGPELVILEVTRPGCDGLDAARTLRCRSRTSGRRILLVALTTLSGPPLNDEAHAAGFDLVVPKAVEGAYLCDLVQGLIDTRALDARQGDPLDRVLLEGTRLH